MGDPKLKELCNWKSSITTQALVMAGIWGREEDTQVTQKREWIKALWLMET